MRKNVLKTVSFILGMTTTLSFATLKVEAQSWTNEQKVAIGTSVSANIVLTGALILKCIFGRSVKKANQIPNQSETPGVSNLTQNSDKIYNEHDMSISLEKWRDEVKGQSDNENWFYYLDSWSSHAKQCSDTKKVDNAKALVAALNIYSLRHCGMKYEALLEDISNQKVILFSDKCVSSLLSKVLKGEITGYSLGNRYYEQIKNILLILAGTGDHASAERDAFSAVISDLYLVQRSNFSQQSEQGSEAEIAKELEVFKKGHFWTRHYGPKIGCVDVELS